MRDNADQGVTRVLAEFVSATRGDSITADMRHEAKRSLINFFACALAGSRDEAVEASASVLMRYSGNATATLIGRTERADALTAAFMNSASANVFDFDDTHAPTIIHPTAPVAAALFAHAENAPIAGTDFLTAFVLGIETECRIGNAVSPRHYRRGWHITSTCGVFGSAVAIGRALDLSPERMVWAIGNASAASAGLLETLGTMSKSISVGNAARNGYAAALYAQAAVAGPAAPLEGRYGFLRVVDDAPDFSRITDGLGTCWELALNMYKPYPCGVVLNPVIDACLAIAASEAIDAADIDRVDIEAHPLLRERTDRPHPRTGRESQVSVQHSVAVCFIRKAAGLPEFSDASAADPALRSLRGKVALIDDTSYGVDSARVTVRLRSGRSFERQVEHARGSTALPLSDHELEQKLRELARYGNWAGNADRLIDAIWALDKAADVGRVMSLASRHSNNQPR
jgi:2-methylcitrate dehydratase PrpD